MKFTLEPPGIVICSSPWLRGNDAARQCMRSSRQVHSVVHNGRRADMLVPTLAAYR